MILHSKAYDDIIDFMLLGKSPEEVIAFKASASTNNRVTELLHRGKGELLSEEEKAELNNYFFLEHIVIRAKARAHKQLRG